MTTVPKFDCPKCQEFAASVAHHYHPDSDVGPFDGACPSCGHLHADQESCEAADRCPVCHGPVTFEATLGDRHCAMAHSWPGPEYPRFRNDATTQERR